MLKKHLYLLLFSISCSVAFYLGFMHISNTYPNDTLHHSIPVSMTQPIAISDSYPTFHGTSAKAACLIDANSGAVLYSHNQNTRVPMASTTKIMTALTVLDVLKPTDIITVPKQAVGIEGSSIYLVENEKISVEDLLYGLLLNSGNDAASALAICSYGSIEAFADAMNKKAHEIGLIDTNFTNPHGLHNENHYTTAYELCLITYYALKNPTIRQIVSTKKHTIPSDTLNTARFFSNHNRLLFSYKGCIGVKTGFTKAAGRCLVSAALRENEAYIAVTLNDSNDWKDHANMLDFAFSEFESIEIASANSFTVFMDGKAYVPKDEIYLTNVKGTPQPTVSYNICKEKGFYTVTYYLDEKKSGRFSLIEKE